MDLEEAERLIKAIENLPVADWIKVEGIEYNPVTSKYELNCTYKPQDLIPTWTKFQLKSPRQWIDLLTQHGGGLELP
jgi:hypothetical protein